VRTSCLDGKCGEKQSRWEEKGEEEQSRGDEREDARVSAHHVLRNVSSSTEWVTYYQKKLVKKSSITHEATRKAV